MEEFIKLENAHVTQHTNGHEKSEWSLEANTTNEKLWSFPKTYTENQIFDILAFGREFESKAWNAGIKFGRDKAREIWEPKLKMAEARIEYMKTENERLAQALGNVYEKIENSRGK